MGPRNLKFSFRAGAAVVGGYIGRSEEVAMAGR